jgi:uncharacterized ubiquitin-like protein YukD
MPRRTVNVNVTTPAGQRVKVDLEPGHTVQDVVAALVQSGKLPGEDSQGNPIRYELVDDSTLSMLPADKPLVDIGIGDGAELRVKPGARAAVGGI